MIQGTQPPPDSQSRPEHSLRAAVPPLRIMAWELTRTCNFRCLHCRASATEVAHPDELTLTEWKSIADSVASFSRPVVILTGGEPMLRSDVYEIASYGSSKGFKMVMATCGTLVSDDAVLRMKKSGIQKVSLSLDGAKATTHDSFRGTKGAFEAIRRAAETLRRGGLPFQVNTTVAKHNVEELPRILELAIELGAVAFHPFLLVPTGRGKNLASLELSARAYERTLSWLAGVSSTVPVEVKPTCAPHFFRRLERKKAETRAKGVSDARGGSSRGCLGGIAFAFVSHLGVVQPCGFLDVECGELRKVGYDFLKIWASSPVFLKIRDRASYRGKCGVCEYWDVCGGCRARAYEVGGDYLGEEPFCLYRPRVLKRASASPGENSRG